MKAVDYNTIADGTDYEPRVGLAYEIADGVSCTLKAPTYRLHELGEEVRQNPVGRDDYAILKQVCSCDKWPAKEDCIPEVVAQAVFDFFTLLLRTSEKQQQRFKALSQPQKEQEESPE